MSNQVIIGLCGSRRIGRVEVLKHIAASHPEMADVTVSEYHRVPWGRAEKLAELIAAADAPVIVAGIKSFEEAEVIEHLGGEVVHIDGAPSEDVPIKRKSILVTLNEPRGRYVSLSTMMEQVKERAAA